MIIHIKEAWTMHDLSEETTGSDEVFCVVPEPIPSGPFWVDARDTDHPGRLFKLHFDRTGEQMIFEEDWPTPEVQKITWELLECQVLSRPYDILLLPGTVLTLRDRTVLLDMPSLIGQETFYPDGVLIFEGEPALVDPRRIKNLTSPHIQIAGE